MSWRTAVLGVLAICVIAVAALAVWSPKGAVATTATPIPTDAQPMIVREVLAGDTVVLVADRPGAQVQDWGSVTARLVGVNAPNFGLIDECFAVEAEGALTALLPEGSIAWVATDEFTRDLGGRWFMYVWTADGVLVNEFLASNGFVTPQNETANELYWPLIAQSAENAARRGVGLWSECS